MTDGVDASLNFRHDKKTGPRSERVGQGWFLPFYKASYIVLKTREECARIIMTTSVKRADEVHYNHLRRNTGEHAKHMRCLKLPISLRPKTLQLLFRPNLQVFLEFL